MEWDKFKVKHMSSLNMFVKYHTEGIKLTREKTHIFIRSYNSYAFKYFTCSPNAFLMTTHYTIWTIAVVSNVFCYPFLS